MRGSRVLGKYRHVTPSSLASIPSNRRLQSGWSAAVSHAQQVAEDASSGPTDPFTLVGTEMTHLTESIHALLGSTDVNLDQVAKYYIRDDGAKRIRPLMVLLMGLTVPRSSNPGPDQVQQERASDLRDESLSPLHILNDANPSSPLSRSSNNTPPTTTTGTGILPSQRRLAEITELIHAASLLHDDVIDASDTRRGRASANFAFSSKMSVLAGDFMLGRASVALARLRHPEVIELLATVIANLVEGEFMQLRNTIDQGHASTMTYYLRKTYLKTAALIAKSCRASAVLGGGSPEHVEAAYAFGKNIGLAFQIVDDMLDYSASAAQLGKPNDADLKLGLATAPVLFAWRQHPELGVLIKRRFSEAGDVERAKRLALDSDGLVRTRELAEQYCRDALAALHILPESASREALEGIAHQVLTRTK